MTLDDPVVASLERAAEVAGDLSREVYERFAARCPAPAALMSHMDEYMLGRMMQDVFVLLMTAPAEVDRHYLSFEVGSHRAYGVTPDMFPPLLEAVRDTLRSHLEDAWSGALDAAWRARIEAIGAEISSVARRAPDSAPGCPSRIVSPG
jgi:hypothetical protein